MMMKRSRSCGIERNMIQKRSETSIIILAKKHCRLLFLRYFMGSGFKVFIHSEM